ncbi:4-deoxy-L-threo-5-hexosulose-uronate ketol-isomerase [Salmonella enterica subsp. enterica serovar Oranienburg]|uniref:4-deoxy-L-threo-5-hexosulose-uronate ketol-isomerase n=1 Tax=Salmonella enterica TaxID=28901 RepID=A0A3J8WNU3_SALER|nr:4-deoxy-L-threo-5-hexosulose-uronate ketol-isomerase [Salmonella enterica]EAU5129633.1 4-deoxy-L-threo-5-hexosulose-uronate ketol-isomerase [Salmonella enterica subsp. enterica serovar Oranienburg]EAO3201839.1 4-deoxy-L-threo-5-hexosulose-uronate ketol-isomerase [Salmonella enterica]EBI8447800.1 4-deoxy-L-threo-5-hexosulose-uronate ketol-isomerase [Salmonella enterica]EBJ0300705.1 4-deoxy-L-threo-5-hexosulose-uronate ketol-isomerase [Salmonella enterica]
MIATVVLKITTNKNETLFYLLLKTFIQATMMPLNKSK